MASQRSSPLRERNRDFVALRLLLPFENLALRNHERADFPCNEPSRNNELADVRRHLASTVTPRSENLITVPNAPMKRRSRFLKKHLRPRKLCYSENKDADDNRTADKQKEKFPLPRVMDIKSSMLRNKSPESSNKENQERGDKLQNLVKDEDSRKEYSTLIGKNAADREDRNDGQCHLLDYAIAPACSIYFRLDPQIHFAKSSCPYHTLNSSITLENRTILITILIN